MGDERLNDCKTTSTVEEGINFIDSAAELRSIEIISFVGGESFLRYQDMLRIADYVFRKYRCKLGASTNCYWAKTYSRALKMLKPLHKRGLVELLLSLDDFHLKYVPIEMTANCLGAAEALGIKCNIQSIITLSSKKGVNLKQLLQDSCEKQGISVKWGELEWIDYPIVPLGRASRRVPDSDLIKYRLAPGNCSVQRVLNIAPDGSVKPCCGPGLVSEPLTIGNAKKESLQSIVKRAEINPLINALVTWDGPTYLAKILAGNCHPEFLQKEWAGPCDACHAILSNKEILGILNNILPSMSISLLTARIAAENGFAGSVTGNLDRAEDLQYQELRNACPP